MLARERLAVFVQQIELGHSGIVLAILCIQCFEAEIAALDSLAKLHFLPAVSGFQRTVGNRFLTFQVQRLPLFTVGSRASARNISKIGSFRPSTTAFSGPNRSRMMISFFPFFNQHPGINKVC